MDRVLFISYSHSDNDIHHWRERLTVFLAALAEELPLSVWDDSEIGAGDKWRREISHAISNAGAAILLVGSGFLASSFIEEYELPLLLQRGSSGDLKLYPLVVGWCPWERSTLEPHQAFNDPKQPLESLSDSDQNMWLNRLGIAIDQDMRGAEIVLARKPIRAAEIRNAMVAIRDQLETTRTAFVAQARLRDGLVLKMKARLQITERLEYELFFFRYYDAMNAEELFDFRRIRAYTLGALHDSNQAILEVIRKHPQVRQELPIVGALKTHLIVWLNKFENVFSNTKEMCLVYVGVEDGVPFPTGVDRAVKEWIAEH